MTETTIFKEEKTLIIETDLDNYPSYNDALNSNITEREKELSNIIILVDKESGKSIIARNRYGKNYI